MAPSLSSLSISLWNGTQSKGRRGGAPGRAGQVPSAGPNHVPPADGDAALLPPHQFVDLEESETRARMGRLL